MCNTPKVFFADGQTDAAARLVKSFHYSKRTPSNVQFLGTWHYSGGLFGDFGEAAAACFFSIPGTRWGQEVWELSRLVRDDKLTVPLSGLISQTIQAIKRSRKHPGLLVSFADATQRHHGGIYQAASWNYAGRRKAAMDGLLIEGKFVPGRSCNSQYGTRSPTKLAAIFPDLGIQPHYDEGKHLYWKAIDKAGTKAAAALGLACLPYPKPRAARDRITDDAPLIANVA